MRLGALAVQSRRHAAGNPYAIFRDRPLSERDYAGSRTISDPLRLFDCDVPVQACVALVLTTADRARDRPWAARLAGVVPNIASGPARLHYTVDDYLERARKVAAALAARSGVGVADLAAVQVYDGFAPSALYWLEAA